MLNQTKIAVGIEAMHVFLGTTCVDVKALAMHRNLDQKRFDNLLMHEKTVALPCEDPVSFAVNAAKPLIDALDPEEAARIEMVITCSESSFDFSKSLSTYVHDLLKLDRHCRLFEIKSACYSGVVGLQTAVNFILSQTSPGAKALVIATDIARFMVEEGEESLTMDWSFSEPSNGAGAVAILVSDRPVLFQIDPGASGYYGYEVMDTCRPASDSEVGDADLSLLTYLSCAEQAFLAYQKRVVGADFVKSFSYMVYHSPFGGMVKGAHRHLMRKLAKISPEQIEQDFQARVMPGLVYCQRVGNIMGASTLLSLASTIAYGDYSVPKRVGIFSYGSGCCSEFFSGIIPMKPPDVLTENGTEKQLDKRQKLTMAQYDALLKESRGIKLGARDLVLGEDMAKSVAGRYDRPLLFLEAIKAYHRVYRWVC